MRPTSAVMVMDPDPAKVDRVHQSILAPPLGQFIEPVWSFVSISEVSEYVPTIERYRDRLIAEGAEVGLRVRCRRKSRPTNDDCQ